jgi:hypothetical protein
MPDGGLGVRTDRVPRWVRIWERTPFLDRRAQVWMWHHGGFELEPAPGFDVPDEGWSTPAPLTSTATYAFRAGSLRARWYELRQRLAFLHVRLEPGGWSMLVLPTAALGAVVGWAAGELVLGALLAAGLVVLAVGVAWVFDRRAHWRDWATYGFGDEAAVRQVAEQLTAEGVVVTAEPPEPWDDRLEPTWRLRYRLRDHRRVEAAVTAHHRIES